MSYVASLRFFAMSWTQAATLSALRPGRVLPTTMATLIMCGLLLWNVNDGIFTVSTRRQERFARGVS